jgi:type I restriction enzyme, S subunit
MSRWAVPDGWEWVKADDIADIIGGGTPPSKDLRNFSTDGIPWLTPADLTGYRDAYIGRGARDLSELGLSKSSAQILPKGTVLFTSRAPIGYCVIASQSLATNQGFKSLVLPDDISPEFLRYYLLASKDYAESLSSGTTFRELSAARMKGLEIPLAPRAEQRRIAAKIEALQERSRRAREALAEVGPLLEQFRQSVLAAAFRGDLTADWRAVHPDIEPASELLNRIRAERRCRWEEAELAKYEAKGQRPPNNWKDRYKEPESVDDSELPELPEGWCWTTLGALALIDSGEAFKKKDYGTSGLRLFQIANVGFGKTLWQQRNYLPEHFAASHGFLLLENTDIAMALNRPVLDGRLKVTRLTDDDLPAILYQRVGRLRTAVSGIVDYLFAFMRSPLMLQQVESNLQGTDQPYINTSDIPDIIVPLAPLAEQIAILTIVSRSFDVEGTVEEQRSAALTELDQLDQSILTKAFRGQLVPQDSNDEPASVLLARIREQRARQAEAAKGTGKTTNMQRRDAMRKNSSRLTLQYRPLVEVLTTKGQPMPPQQLLTEAGYDDDSIEDFYSALRNEIAQGRIRENRLTESDVMLEAV